MGAAVSIATPLGPLRVAVDAPGEPARAPFRRSILPSGVQVIVWSDVGGLVVDVLVTAMQPFAGTPMDLPPTDMWGVEWRLHAPASTTEVTVSAQLLDDEVHGVVGGDENLSSVEFFTPEWVLAVGGPDTGWLSEQAHEDRQPASWRCAPVQVDVGDDGLLWRLSPLEATETARLHVAVAWCRTGHPGSQSAPSLAVDTAPSAIRESAGVVSRTERRRRAHGT